MLASAAIVALLLAIVLLTVATPVMIWWIPSYRALRDRVHRLSTLQIQANHTFLDLRGKTLGYVAKMRLTELFAIDDTAGSTIQMEQFFGLLYFEKEALDESLLEIRRNASVILLVIILGAMWVSLQEDGAKELTSASYDQVLPKLLHLLMQHHFVLATEGVIIVFTLLHIVTSAGRIRRLLRQI